VVYQFVICFDVRRAIGKQRDAWRELRDGEGIRGHDWLYLLGG
jgi:hypothetical protein